MDQTQHVRLLAALHLIFGVFGLVALLLFRLFFTVLLPFVTEALNDLDPVLASFGSLGIEILRFVGYSLFFGIILPSIVGAFATLRSQTWGIYLLLFSGCLRLINFPLGTALGVYTLWVFFKFQEQKGQ